MFPVGANATLHGPSPQENVLPSSLPAQAFVKHLVDGKWGWKEQGGLGYILTSNKLAAHNTRKAHTRLAGYVLINRPGTLAKKATHWLTKDIWLGTVFPAEGPSKQPFSRTKAVWAPRTSLPPRLLWAPAGCCPASPCSASETRLPGRPTGHCSDAGTCRLSQAPGALPGFGTFMPCLASSKFW